jgi:hypothetical protein
MNPSIECQTCRRLTRRVWLAIIIWAVAVFAGLAVGLLLR